MAKSISGCTIGQFVTFSTRDRSVTGRVKKLVFGKTSGDYQTVILDCDGMEYHFGTGGHLGTTWTTESGAEQWFKD